MEMPNRQGFGDVVMKQVMMVSSLVKYSRDQVRCKTRMCEEKSKATTESLAQEHKYCRLIVLSMMIVSEDDHDGEK